MVDSFAARFEQLRSRRDELLAWLTKRQQRRYECRHPQRHPVRYTQSDGRQVAREQCRACGHLGRALPLRALPPLEALPPVDDALTCHEIRARTGWSGDFARPRLWELEGQQLVNPKKRRRTAR